MRDQSDVLVNKHKKLFKSSSKFGLFFYFVVILMLTGVFISSKIYDHKTIEYKDEVFYKLSESILKKTKLLIDEKMNSSTISVMSLTKNPEIANKILGKKSSLDLKKLSIELRDNTNFKNVWFMLLDKKGKVIERSWSDLKNDNILKDNQYIEDVIKNNKIKSVLNVNKFDLVFSSFAPIIYDENVIGAVAVITHFNSIATQLLSTGFKPVVFLNSKYSNKLNIKNTFCDIFIGECYVANLNADEQTVKMIHDRGLEHYVDFEGEYHVHDDTNTFETLYKLNNSSGDHLGSIILIKDVDEVDMGNLELFQNTHIGMTAFFLFVVSVLSYYIRTHNYTEKIREDNKKLFILNASLNEKNDELDFNEKKIANIFHIQPNIMIVSNGLNIETVNEKFLSFFDQYENLEQFKQEHTDISDFFEPFDGDEYFSISHFGDIPWKDYILSRPKETFKVVMKDNKDGKLNHFVIKMNEMKYAKYVKRYIVISFINITHEIELAIASKEKEEAMLEQRKMAQMGEMIGFISHQWRQPLSSISLAASGMKFKSDLGLLKDGDISEFADNITENSKFLSDTIEDFTKFIKEKKEVQQVDIKDRIELVLKIIGTTYKSNNILIKKQITEEPLLKTLVLGELSQSLMNLFSNAKDELVKLQKNDSWIEIIVRKEENSCIITVEDNAGGIPDDIIENIFDKYYTTKEEDKGTGLGLFMTKDLIEKNLKGNLSVKNTKNGAMFMIKVPLDEKKVD